MPVHRALLGESATMSAVSTGLSPLHGQGEGVAAAPSTPEPPMDLTSSMQQALCVSEADNWANQSTDFVFSPGCAFPLQVLSKAELNRSGPQWGCWKVL